MQKDNNLNLDDLMLSSGTEFDPTKEKIIKNQQLAYEDGQELLPGMNIAMPTSDEVAMSQDEANENVVKHIAMNKLAKENEAFNKLSDDEKVKDYVCQAQYYKETNDFYHKYGYEMSGKQKRYTKRAIEQAWKKGKLKVTPEQREDILYELSKASKQKLQTQEPQKQSQPTTAGYIKDLNQLIFRQ